MSDRVTLEQAISLHLVEYARSHAAKTCRHMRSTLAAFHLACRRQWLDEIMPYDINTYLAAVSQGSQTMRRAHLKHFVLWANKRFKLNLYVQPSEMKQPLHGVVVGRGLAAKLAVWTSQIEQVAARMTLPHQRAIFLLGYQFGWSLRKVLMARRADLANLPLRSDLLVALSAALTNVPDDAIFSTWLGKGGTTAGERWSEWSGGVPFGAVRWAGSYARFLNGIRPTVGGYQMIKEMANLLPEADLNLLERLPRFWEGR